MADGNTENVAVWDDCDIYFSTEASPTIPADIDTPFSADWDPIGLLDGEAGTQQGVDQPSTSHRAWKVGVVRKTYQGAEMTYSFTALEDNDTTELLTRPNYHPPVFVGFEWREGTKVRREITRIAASVTLNGEVTRSETGLTQFPLQVTVYPDPSVDASTANQFITIQQTAPASV